MQFWAARSCGLYCANELYWCIELVGIINLYIIKNSSKSYTFPMIHRPDQTMHCPISRYIQQYTVALNILIVYAHTYISMSKHECIKYKY